MKILLQSVAATLGDRRTLVLLATLWLVWLWTIPIYLAPGTDDGAHYL